MKIIIIGNENSKEVLEIKQNLIEIIKTYDLENVLFVENEKEFLGCNSNGSIGISAKDIGFEEVIVENNILSKEDLRLLITEIVGFGEAKSGSSCSSGCGSCSSGC